MLLHSSIVYKDYYFIIKPLIHVLVCLIFTVLLKYITSRPRPELDPSIKRIYNCRNRESNGSMPSGDALQSANFAIILIYYYNSYIGLLFIPCVVYSRVFYSCHYLVDTIVGVIMGFVISIIMYNILNAY